MEEPMEITNLEPTYLEAMDIRGLPTTICPCGSKVWNLKTIFEADTGNIDMYFIDMECAVCGTLATAPTPGDFEVQDAN
jgi:hypothetical protein